MKSINKFILEKLKIHANTKINSKDKENWSIENAENGDIVSKLDGILLFIYKGLNSEYKINNAGSNAIVYHATYITDDRKKLEVKTDTGVGTIDKPEQFKLATDEQCEEFYQALEKNGYKWDDNKKEIVEL